MTKWIQPSCIGMALLFSSATYAQAPVLDLSNDELLKRIEVLERIVQSRNATQQRFQAELTLVQDEVSQLRGQIEEQNFRIEKILQRQKEILLALDKQIQLANQVPAQSVAANTNDEVPAKETEAVAEQLVDENVAYQNAVDLILKAKDYDAAIPAFKRFIAQYPNSEFIANAHYWLGQLLYNKRQWQAALTQFEVIVSQFQTSTKHADALLKAGLAYQRLGQAELAKERLTRVVKEYSSSTSARLAQDALKKL